MLEDEYINFDVYKKSILDSFGFEFKKIKTKIKSPYFVMYVKEYLENKYGKKVVEQG
jgi:membrane carboxypeptidase/penicillin-binding protein